MYPVYHSIPPKKLINCHRQLNSIQLSGDQRSEFLSPQIPGNDGLTFPRSFSRLWLIGCRLSHRLLNTSYEFPCNDQWHNWYCRSCNTDNSVNDWNGFKKFINSVNVQFNLITVYSHTHRSTFPIRFSEFITSHFMSKMDSTINSYECQLFMKKRHV